VNPDQPQPLSLQVLQAGRAWASVYTAIFPPSIDTPVYIDVDAPVIHTSVDVSLNPVPVSETSCTDCAAKVELMTASDRYPKRARRPPSYVVEHESSSDVSSPSHVVKHDSSCAPTKVRVAVHSMKRAHRAPPSHVVKDDSSSDVSDDDAPLCQQALAVGCTFGATDTESAKAWLLQEFRTHHPGGKPRCVNSRYVCTQSPYMCVSCRSRFDYVYVTCKFCRVSCAARPTKKGGIWHATKVETGALSQCTVVPPGLIQCPAVAPSPQATKVQAVSTPLPQVACDVCSSDSICYIVCGCQAKHVVCTDCMSQSVASQCSHLEEFAHRRGITCPFCPKGSWRYSLDKIKLE
jgi:hypothetical protein